MKTFLVYALLALFTIAATANSPFEKEGLALPGGWRIGQATLMDNDLTGLAKRDNKYNAQVTWYDGQDLNNAACYGSSGVQVYNAKPTDFIGAMWMRNLEMCYQCLEIKNGKAKVESIIVKIVDKCAGCPPDGKNVDLTQTAFQKLASLDDGRIEIVWRPLPNCPKTGAWPTFEKSGRKVRRSKFM